MDQAVFITQFQRLGKFAVGADKMEEKKRYHLICSPAELG